MAMRAETLPGLHPVLVDDPQRAEAHVPAVMVFTKGKSVPAVQPAEIGATAFIGLANL
jgi:hypothetical protein